jgi:hypothetical protein
MARRMHDGGRSSRHFRHTLVEAYHRVPHAAASAVFAQAPSSSILYYRTDAFARGAMAALPALNSAWLEGRTRPIALLVGFAIVAILALFVASAALLNDQRHRKRSAIDDEELFTTTPLPMPKEELARLKRQSPHAFSGVRLPRWLQIGSILAALVVTYAVAQRIQPADGRNGTDNRGQLVLRGGAADRTRGDDTNDSPEDLDLTPASAPAFAFRVREWVASNGGCAGLMEVTKGEPRSWNLTARVHDGRGQLMDTAHARVSALTEGEVVEFRFPRVACDRIGAWEVRGAPRTP